MDADLAGDDRLRQVLHDYFAWATSNVNRYHESADDVPDGLPDSPLVVGRTRQRRLTTQISSAGHFHAHSGLT